MIQIQQPVLKDGSSSGEETAVLMDCGANYKDSILKKTA